MGREIGILEGKVKDTAAALEGLIVKTSHRNVCGQPAGSVIQAQLAGPSECAGGG
jgi:hypothetical protein